jgi:hypothetical protein
MAARAAALGAPAPPLAALCPLAASIDTAEARKAPKRAERRPQRAYFRRYYYEKLSGAVTDHPAQDEMAAARPGRSLARPSGRKLLKRGHFRFCTF